MKTLGSVIVAYNATVDWTYRIVRMFVNVIRGGNSRFSGSASLINVRTDYKMKPLLPDSLNKNLMVAAPVKSF